MTVIIDRFEGEYAVVEIDEELTVDVPRVLFPFAKEGDVIRIEIDNEETEKRKNRIDELMNNLFED